MVNIAADVWAHADVEPGRVAVRSPRVISYGELREVNARVAGAVRAAGVRPLDRVLFIAPSIPEFPEVYYGLHAAGATVITMATPAEIGYVLDDAGVSLVIAWHDRAVSAAAAAKERALPCWRIEPGFSFEAEPLRDVHQHEPHDTALILYTSGTTGRPKGAELTAANLVDTVTSFDPVLNLSKDDRFGTGLPLFHVYGQAVCMNTTLATGASFSLVHPFDPARMLDVMVADQLTSLAGVPTMWNAMFHVEGDYTPEDFSALRMATSGGASLPVEVIRAFSERFGCTILEGYGLTESTGRRRSTTSTARKRPVPSARRCPGRGSRSAIRRGRCSRPESPARSSSAVPPS